MRYIIIAAAALALLGGGFSPAVHAGSTAGSETRTEKKFLALEPREARELIDSRDDLLVIDVRSPEEYYQGALPGSKLIPFWDVMKGNHGLPIEQPVLLVCAVGGRSYAAGQYLSLRGHREIYNLSGGLSAWAQQGVPLPEKKTVAR